MLDHINRNNIVIIIIVIIDIIPSSGPVSAGAESDGLAARLAASKTHWDEQFPDHPNP